MALLLRALRGLAVEAHEHVRVHVTRAAGGRQIARLAHMHAQLVGEARRVAAERGGRRLPGVGARPLVAAEAEAQQQRAGEPLRVERREGVGARLVLRQRVPRGAASEPLVVELRGGHAAEAHGVGQAGGRGAAQVHDDVGDGGERGGQVDRHRLLRVLPQNLPAAPLAPARAERQHRRLAHADAHVHLGGAVREIVERRDVEAAPDEAAQCVAHGLRQPPVAQPAGTVDGLRLRELLLVGVRLVHGAQRQQQPPAVCGALGGAVAVHARGVALVRARVRRAVHGRPEQRRLLRAQRPRPRARPRRLRLVVAAVELVRAARVGARAARATQPARRWRFVHVCPRHAVDHRHEVVGPGSATSRE